MSYFTTSDILISCCQKTKPTTTMLIQPYWPTLWLSEEWGWGYDGLGVEQNQKQRIPVYSVTSWIISGTHQCKQINWSLLTNQALHGIYPFSAVTKWFILEYHVVSEIYVQEQQVITGTTGIFLSAFDDSVQVPELIKQNLLYACFSLIVGLGSWIISRE